MAGGGRLCAVKVKLTMRLGTGAAGGTLTWSASLSLQGPATVEDQIALDAGHGEGWGLPPDVSKRLRRAKRPPFSFEMQAAVPQRLHTSRKPPIPANRPVMENPLRDRA